MLKFGQCVAYGGYGLYILALKLIEVSSAIFQFLMTKSAFRRSRELAKRDMERPGGKMSWFTPDESVLVDVLASLIVPSDDMSPGAQDAEIVNVLERYVANSLERKELYSRGLYSFDEWAQWKHGVSFIKLPHERQLTLMKVIDREYRNLYASVVGKLMRKVRVLPYLRNGLFPAVELFPILVDDVFRAFYTNAVSWVWLGYDGPPMPDGYPGLSERRPITNESETTTFDPSLQQSDDERRILVCLKQVPSKDSHYEIDDSGYGINQENLTYETNENDLYALEEALRLKRKFGGEVTILSCGENRVLTSLKEGLAKGADRAVHINNGGFQDGDAFVTAKAIAAAIYNEKFDLVLTGVESGDLAYGQTGILLAHLLNRPYVTIAVNVDIGEDWKNAIVKRELENNAIERVEVSLPAVLSVQTSTTKIGYTDLKGILQARKKEIRTLSTEELGLKSSDFGKQGSRIDNMKLFIPEKKKNMVMLEGSANEIAKALIERLHKHAKVF
jgi:electron transfer flavoprotein beta subunit